MKRITCDTPRTPTEVAAIQVAREQVEAELPELIAQYEERGSLSKPEASDDKSPPHNLR